MKKTTFASSLAALALIPATLFAAPATYQVDPVHSFVTFKIRHFGVGNAYGEFKSLKGTIVEDKDAPENSSIKVEIDANSLDTKNPMRDEHVKSAELLNVKEFPTLGFESESIKKLSGEDYELTGKFTMHGQTKPITVKFTKIGEGKDPKGTMRVGGESTFTIKRSEYGMDGMIPALGDEVTVTVALEGVPEKKEKEEGKETGNQKASEDTQPAAKTPDSK